MHVSCTASNTADSLNGCWRPVCSVFGTAALCDALGAPFRNHLTYLLTYLLAVVSVWTVNGHYSAIISCHSAATCEIVKCRCSHMSRPVRQRCIAMAKTFILNTAQISLISVNVILILTPARAQLLMRWPHDVAYATSCISISEQWESLFTKQTW